MEVFLRFGVEANNAAVACVYIVSMIGRDDCSDAFAHVPYLLFSGIGIQLYQGVALYVYVE